MSRISLAPNASGTGTLTIAAPDTNTDRTLTLPDNSGTVVTTASTGGVSQAMLASGVAGTGPAFRAFQSGSQAISDSTDTKITLDGETFDVGSRFNNTSSTVGGIPAYAFMPDVAGYYQINGRVGLNSATFPWGFCSIWKNGGLIARGSASNSTSFSGSNISDVVYLNGTTDYVNLYMVISGASSSTEAPPGGAGLMTYFSGALVRAA